MSFGDRRWAGLLTILTLSVAAACGDALGPDYHDEVESFVGLVNDYRASVGCEPLTWRADLAEVAQGHSEDMLQRDFFSHTNPDGATPWDRLAVAGIDYGAAGENLAIGYLSAGEVLVGWLDSPPHRHNIENCRLTHHGIGLRSARWTHLLVRP